MEQIEKIQGTEKEFIKVFQELCYSRSSWQVWADLMAAMACTLANSVDKTEPRYTAREKEYAECIKRLGGVENTDDGYRASVATSQISFSTTPVRLPWEVTEETLRQNIEGENMNKVITDLMTSQLGVDLEDLYLNGDENAGKAKAFSQSDTYSAGDIVTYNKKLYKFDVAHSAGAWTGADTALIGEEGDADFLKVNDGWIKQIKEGGHILDKSTEDEMSLDMFYQMVASIPNKYNNGKLRWLMSPRRAQQWELFLLNLVAHHGGAVPDNMYTAPVKIPTVECPSMSDDMILLTDPKNLIVVNSYTVKIRSTNTDKESIMMDKRFYVAHLDYDPIIEEKDATGILLLKR